MKTCYFCGLNAEQYEDEPIEHFELRRLRTNGDTEVMDVDGHASCHDFFTSKRPNPLRESETDEATKMERETQ